MYLVSVILLLLVFPAGSVAVEDLAHGGNADLLHLVGKWFVFWGAGVRLFIAGLRQVGSRVSPPKRSSRLRSRPPMPSCAKSASAIWQWERSAC